MLLGFWALLYLARSSMQDSVDHLSQKIEEFSCVGKVIGGYYADVQSNCQMFHVCTLGEKGELQDIAFLCIKGTAFKQESRVCERDNEVDCSDSEKFYYLNEELYGPGIIPDTAIDLNGNFVDGASLSAKNPYHENSINELSLCSEKTEDCISKKTGAIKLYKKQYQNDFISLLLLGENSRSHLVVKRDTAVDLNRNLGTNARDQALIKDNVNIKKRNDTLVEVSEIVAPDQSGRVIITSIVPKLVTQNIFTEKEKDDTPKVSVSTGQSRVVVNSEATESESSVSPTEAPEEPTTTTTVSTTEAPEEPTTTTTEEVVTATPETTPQPKNVSQNTTKPQNTTVSSIQEDTSGISEGEIIETNFTCKDKDLERFYPDIEAECKVFHYCAPGFSEDQVLDLKFLCTGNTRFDSKTSKCQDKNQVTCIEVTASEGPAFETKSEEPKAETSPSTTKEPDTTTPAPTTPSTTPSTTTTSSTTTTTIPSSTTTSPATIPSSPSTSPSQSPVTTITPLPVISSEISHISESEVDSSTSSQVDSSTTLPAALRNISEINYNESIIEETGDIESKLLDQLVDNVTMNVTESEGIELTTLYVNGETSAMEKTDVSSTEMDTLTTDYEVNSQSEPIMYDIEYTTVDVLNKSLDTSDSVYNNSTIVR